MTFIEALQEMLAYHTDDRDLYRDGIKMDIEAIDKISKRTVCGHGMKWNVLFVMPNG